MAYVSLGRADIALFSDPVETRVELPYLTAFTPVVTPPVSLVAFEGFDAPHAYRGEHVRRSLSFTALFPRARHSGAVAFLALLSRAATDPDGRLQLRTHIGEAAGLDDLEVFVATGWSQEPQPGRNLTVSVDGVRVAHSLGV